MKKLLLLLTIFFLPLNTYAYSDYIIPGGNTIGIEVATDGVMIIGFYKVEGKLNKGNPALEAGDYITQVNDIKVNSVSDLTKAIEKYAENEAVTITYRRDNKQKTTNFPLVYSDGKYKTGLYVKSSIKGIGSVSYIDPNTKIFGALGHEIMESSTSDSVEIKSGIIFENYITGIEKSIPGSAGSKIAKFNYDVKYGSILKNTKYGIYGTYDADINSSQALKVGSPKIGQAVIKTVLEGQEVEEFAIEITRINETADTKNITFKILSEELLTKTGGVVQGMSGSPIIQNDEIVGVLTHVIVDNPITGYGIFITTMLEEGEK